MIVRTLPQPLISTLASALRPQAEQQAAGGKKKKKKKTRGRKKVTSLKPPADLVGQMVEYTRGDFQLSGSVGMYLRSF